MSKFQIIKFPAEMIVGWTEEFIVSLILSLLLVMTINYIQQKGLRSREWRILEAWNHSHKCYPSQGQHDQGWYHLLGSNA